MNILYIDHYAGSLSMGMEFRPFYFAREWKKAGHRVRILGANFSHLRKNNPSVKRDLELQTIDGQEFQWLITRTYQGNGAARALSMFEFCHKLSKYAGKIADAFKPDIVISSSTYPLDAYPAHKIAKLAGAGYVHETHDLWPLTLIEIGGMSRLHPFVILMGMAERYAYRKSDAVIGVTAAEVEYMLRHGLQNRSKFTHIPNGVVPEDWENTETVAPLYRDVFQEFKNSGRFIVCYLGGHAISNALDALIDAAKMSDGKNELAFVLIGDGVEKDRLMKKAEGLRNICFLPPIAKKQVPSVLQLADVLYVGAEPSSIYRYGVSMNKVYDYMMAGKPIINGVKAANDDVREAGCGLTIPPREPKKIVHAALHLMKMHTSDIEKMGNNGRKWVTENCSYGVLSKRFIEAARRSSCIT